MSIPFVSLNIKSPKSITVDEYLKGCLLLSKEFAYRGHGSHNWDLIPSAFRSSSSALVDTPGRLERLQYFSSPEFKLDFDRLSEVGASREGLELKTRGHTDGYVKLQKMIFFQQFGIPTPLLDWTYSPIIALFMAFTFMPKASKKMRIYQLDRPQSPGVLIFQDYNRFSFERIRRQLGGVSFFGDVDGDFKNISISPVTFGEYCKTSKDDSFISYVDVKMNKGHEKLITGALVGNGFTIEAMFPNSPYWVGQAISSRLPWVNGG